MILHKIILENFRQFKGKQEIKFDGSLPNITIIYGDNGRGKTGIFRALMFGLFAERRLSQDDDVDLKDIYLVNTQALKENNGSPVNASVTVILSSQKETFEIKREIIGLQKDNENIEQSGKVSLTIVDEYGNTKPPLEDSTMVSEIIGKIFDPKIKDYFLFDGEKIERLTRADAGQKRIVAQGIKNLLNINDLETACRGMKRLGTELNKQLEKKSQGRLPKLLAAINDNAEELEKLEEKNENIKAEESNARDQSEKIKFKLSEIEEVDELTRRLNYLIEKEHDIVDNQRKLLPVLIKKIPDMSLAVFKNTFNKIYQDLDMKKATGEIPVQYKLELIKKILSEQECICGSEIREGDTKHDMIVSWQKKIQESELSDEALNLWRDLNTLLEVIPKNIYDIQTQLKQMGDNERKEKEIQKAIKAINEEINHSSVDDARRFNSLLEKYRKDIGKYEEQRCQLEKQKDQLLEEKKDLLKKREAAIQDEGLKSELEAATNLVTDVSQAFEDVYCSFTSDIKEELSLRASMIMKKLLDDESLFSLSKIVVKDDYSLQVNDHRNEPFLANISSGQRQIISICFITALALVANSSERFELPLFMDTPFGRLSLEHRINLINYIPTICQQWITMVTDTELTLKEWKTYQQAGYKCLFYKLDLQDDGTTLIKRIELENVLNHLK